MSSLWNPFVTPLCLFSISIGDEDKRASSHAAGVRYGAEFLSTTNCSQEWLRKWTHLVELKTETMSKVKQIANSYIYIDTLPAHTCRYRNPHMQTLHTHTLSYPCFACTKISFGLKPEPVFSTVLYFITNTWHFRSPPLASARLLSVSPERLRCPLRCWAV